MTAQVNGRVLFLCDRPMPDPAVGTVAAELGYDLVRAGSTGDALLHASGTGFALVLAGYSGDLEGTLEGIRRLRVALPLTPLVAHGVPHVPPFPLECLYEAGAVGVLHDPVSPAILRAKVRFYLDAYASAAERRRAEAALGEARANLESIIAAAEVAVWSWAVGADRVRGDERMTELFALEPAQASDAPLAEYFAAIHPDDLPATEALLARALQEGTPYEATFRVRTREGGWRWLLARGQVESGTEGPVRLQGVVIDVTLRKQAEERLQASEERYRTLFDAIDDSVAVVEAVQDEDGRVRDVRFLEVNRAFVRHTGLQDAPGGSLRLLVGDDAPLWFDLCGKVCADGEPLRFDNEAAVRERWFDIYLARVGPAGSRRAVLLLTDITERRRTELELRRLADGLAEQDRLKTEFLATLAHELRNPLAPIRSGLQFMRRAKNDGAAVARVQDIMDRQLDHLVHLVDDLLDVARITRGQVDLKPDWIDLADVLNAAVDTSMPLIEASRHQLDVRLPPAPLLLYADPTRITQVVSNLLNNAAKYTPRGGAIVLAAERDGEAALIAVSDNGIGIAPDDLGNVFKMFTQVSQTHRTQGGLGIGLSLVRSLVELHGGSVSAASNGPNAGSVFTVRLPLTGPGTPHRPPPGLQDAPQAAPAGAPQGLRVLVVDDNRDAAETLSALLGMLGHSCAVANDGYQALRMLPGLQPEVVFLDIGMPGMSGYDVAHAVRADARFAGLRLVALTGWGGEADRARTAAAGFDAHLTKPATVAAIEEVMARLVPAAQA